jgi:FADH2 O2-dependent halogenase
LVSSHFAGVDTFMELSAGPYPDECAAVHHLIGEGWVYALPFDHGVVSAGVLLRRSAYESLVDAGVHQPEAVWREVLSRYPSLQLQFAKAQPVEPFLLAPRVQRLQSTGAGPGWAMLPHTFAFFDPMFSTGIAWSLIGVERLAGILEAAGGDDRWQAASVQPSLERYSRQLQAEARQMATLLEGAYAAMHDFQLFTAQSLLYFAVVSHAEVDQRLWPEGHDGVAPAWQGFLGAGDVQLEEAFAESLRRLTSISADRQGATASAERLSFNRWMLETIAPWNVGGFGDPRRQNLYPVDLDLLIDRAALLGLTADQMKAKLPLLRGRSARG